ncbi:hypothetical protein ACQPZF_05720 [Actinosynnema sp. CS-041913]|uniref:hypothetical protein n=1 Tax=Actinosynnema sp. CS-041913 TaxID=3239917 RepID=UPI003D9337BA
MKYERDLQVRLRERFKRLYKTEFRGYNSQMRLLRDFIIAVPTLKAIIDYAGQDDPEFRASEWVDQNFSRHNQDWPDTEEKKFKVLWYLINQLTSGDEDWDWLQVADFFTFESQSEAMTRAIAEQVFEPFIEYLEDKLGTESTALYQLDRLRQRIERFDIDELHAAYSADTARGEAIYDHYMQKFLFDQGIEHVISKPRTASGEADVVANLDSDDALVVEMKLYNGSNYGVTYLRKGFNQAVQYAHDHGKTTGHLVVVNLSDDNLQFESDEPTAMWPPRLHASGVTIYIVAIRALPTATASRRGNQQTVAVTKANLVRMEAE